MLSALPCEFRAVCLLNRGAGGSAISWRTLRLPCNRSLSYNNVTIRYLYSMSPFGYYLDVQEWRCAGCVSEPLPIWGHSSGNAELRSEWIKFPWLRRPGRAGSGLWKWSEGNLEQKPASSCAH